MDQRHQSSIKFLSKRFGTLIESIHEDAVTSFLKIAGQSAAELSVPDSQLPSGASNLPASDLIRLAGISEKDYRVLAGQGLVFLQKIFEKYQPCGNLHPLVYEGGMLWLCKPHWDKMKTQIASVNSSRRDELLTKYMQHIEAHVSRVRIPGDSEPHDLKRVFVQLTIRNELNRPSSHTQAEYLGLMDAELRRRRNPLSDRGLATDYVARISGRNIEPEELLKSYSRCILVGALGAGKSTLMKYLAYRTFNQKERLPLFLELKTLEKQDFEATDGQLTELVFEQCVARTVCENETERATMRTEFLRRLHAGTLSIFLDGLDEVSGEEFFGSLRQSVRDFIDNNNYRGNRLYVSTRPYALLDRFSRNQAQEMEIAPFNQEQIEQFVRHYYPGELGSENFLEELRRRPELRELARVPALLGFLILLYRNQGSAPENRLDLYREVVHQLASEWDKEKPAKRAFQTTDARRVDFLGYLAFIGFLNEADQQLSQSLVFSTARILKLAEKYCRPRGLSNKADTLAEEVKATPLLRQVGTDSYAFAHLTIQEYLAAITLVEHEDFLQIFRRAYFNSTLVEMEFLPMVVGLVCHKEKIFDTLEQLPDSLDFKKLRLEARSLKYGEVTPQILQRLVRILTGMITEDEIEFGYFEIVVKSFRDSTKPTREFVAQQLEDELENEAEVYRSRAVSMLGLLKNESADLVLLKALSDHESAVRIKAASYLALTTNNQAFHVLMEEFKSSDNDIRQEVVYALWQIGNEEAIDCLKSARSDENSHIRGLAYEALAGLLGEAAIHILAEGVKDGDEWVRRIAVDELGEIGGDAAIAPLMFATGDKTFSVCERALLYLGQIGGEGVIPFLREFLLNHHGQILGAAAEAIALVGDKSAISKLAELLEDYKDRSSKLDFISVLTGGWIFDYVKVRIAKAMLSLGDERGRPILIEALADGDEGERDYAAWALSRMGETDVAPTLFKLLEKLNGKRESILMANALERLGLVDDERVVEAANSVIKRSQGYFVDGGHVQAVRLLGRIGGEQAINGLINACEHSNPRTQIAAVEALGRISNKLVVMPLLQSLGPTVNAVSQSAAEALARLDDMVLYEGLLLSLASEYRYVRRKAAQSIAYYSYDGRATQILASLSVDDPGERVRSEATKALEYLMRKEEWTIGKSNTIYSHRDNP